MADFVLEFERPIVDLEDTIQGLRDLAERGGIDVADQIAQLEEKASALRKEVFAELSPYQRTQISRHQQRPLPMA